jgi:hypothetical protein
MLSCEDYVNMLSLRQGNRGPQVVFVGMSIFPSASIRGLLVVRYGVKPTHVSPENLATMNTDSCAIFVFTKEAFETEQTLKDLWRVAREGSLVFIVEETSSKPIEIENAEEYGLRNMYGSLAGSPNYALGLMRKDTAKHFHK